MCWLVGRVNSPQSRIVRKSRTTPLYPRIRLFQHWRCSPVRQVGYHSTTARICSQGRPFCWGSSWVYARNCRSVHKTILYTLPALGTVVDFVQHCFQLVLPLTVSWWYPLASIQAIIENNHSIFRACYSHGNLPTRNVTCVGGLNCHGKNNSAWKMCRGSCICSCNYHTLFMRNSICTFHPSLGTTLRFRDTRRRRNRWWDGPALMVVFLLYARWNDGPAV